MAADPSLWEAFSLGSYYDCGKDRCPESVAERWHLRSRFEEHLRVSHSSKFVDDNDERALQEQADNHRRIWKYKPRQ